MSGGGSLTTRNMTGQKVTDGAVFQSYTAGQGTLAVSATADAGYTLKSLTVNGTALGNPGSVTINGSDKNISAVFVADGFSVRSNGTPAQLGGVYQGYSLKTPVTFTFAPAPGYAVTAINTGDIPVAAANWDKSVFPKQDGKISSSIPGTKNGRATVTLPAGYVFTGGFNLSATQAPMLAILKPAATVVTTVIGLDSAGQPNKSNVSATVMLPSGSNTTYTYNWTLASGPQNTRALNTSGGDLSSATGSAYEMVAGPALSTMSFTQNAATGAASFVPAVAGQYKLLLTATPNDGSAQLVTMVTVNALASVKQANDTSCAYCHTANNIRTVADTSSHATCQSCHFEGAGHPGSVSAGTVSASTFLVNSDNVSNGNGTTAAKGTNFCASCHGVTGNPAQAIPALTTHQDKACADCHTSAHDTHVASAACQTCHATVHSAAAMGTNGCLDCHDGHRPTLAKPLIGSVSHPAVTLYTFEEVGYQMNGGQPVPVQVDANGKGMPYSPKMTCGTSGCHVIGGVNYTYDKISDHAFHSAQGRNEYQDTADGKLDARKNKPWGQSTAMVGKW